MEVQQPLFNDLDFQTPIISQPFKTQLLKWIGNKQRFAHEIISYFPKSISGYYEPFLGSGAVLGTLAPANGVGSDVLKPLIDIWQALAKQPLLLKNWYRERWDVYTQNPEEGYQAIRSSYNTSPNGADLLFICRACYGGVVRFRKSDGYISTPKGIHKPITPESFAERVNLWHTRVKNTTFHHSDFEETMLRASKGDLIYCDPPYVDSQTILYGAQKFELERLFKVIERCKAKGVSVALSIDGTKKTGERYIPLDFPTDLFEREVFVNCGRSMLRRFQKEGETLEDEVVTDRLLLTY